MGDNLKVAVRVRPFNDREKQRNAKLVIEMHGDTTIIKDPNNMEGEGRKYTFDYSYWSHDGFKERDDGYLEPEDGRYADQARVFEDLGKGVLSNAWQGFNCSLFAYGQTGSGKSYSMVGYGENKGIIPVSCEELFKGIEERKLTDDVEREAEYQVSVSMLEIYNESVKDLLNTKSFKKGGLRVREHPQKGFYVEQLQISPVRNYKDIEGRIAEGNFNRTVAATNMNATSSRAHTIVSINFAQKAKNDAGKSMTKTSVINLVDLAGSERADSTGATGDRLKEGSMINKSLLCLGNCIKAVADKQMGKATNPPFRDSTLTRLLKNALGGNSKTIMIAALSPAGINYDETVSTLRFADRAKSIKTRAVVNESPTDKLIREMKEEIKRLQDQLKLGGGPGGVIVQGIPEDQVEEMRKQMEEELKKNQKEMEDMKLSWQQRLKDQEEGSMKMLMDERSRQEARKTTPHFWNLNEDPMLTGMIVHFVPAGHHALGNAEPADIVLKGLSVEKDHATIDNRNNSSIKIVPKGAVLVNGVTIDKETELRHNDRVMFGSTHLYVFHHPQDAAIQEKEGKPVERVTFDSAQQEIAEKKGFDMNMQGKSPEEILLQEDITRALRMLGEANAMSAELDKKMVYKLELLSPQARGLKEGRTQVLVRAKDLTNGKESLWKEDSFVDRKYVMQEMYQNYAEGEEDWDCPQIEMEDILPVTSSTSKEECKMKINIVPCHANGMPFTEDEFTDEPNELLGTSLCLQIRIEQLLGLNRKFSHVWCRYKMHQSNDWNTSEVIELSSGNPLIDFEKTFPLNPVTKTLLNDLLDAALIIQVWGRQKPGNLDSSLANMTTKQLVGLDEDKLRYSFDKGTASNRKADTQAEKRTEKKATAAVNPETEKALKQKEVQIQSLRAEVNRLRAAKDKEASKANVGFQGGESVNSKMALVTAVVNEAKRLKKETILRERLASILQTGRDLPSTEIKQIEEKIGENKPSKTCVIM